MKTRILLTGATTLVGAEVLNELLRREDVETLVLISGSNEVARLESYLGPLSESVTTLQGDPHLLRFGFSTSEWEQLARSISIGFHCAQRETTHQDLESARQYNVRPGDDWIDMLDRNPNLHLHHLSTGFVCGTRRGLFTEFDLNCGQGFNNAWQRSKFEAEVRLRESLVSKRITIYRPSHVLGRATDEKAFELGGAYSLIATLAGASILPGDTHARLDFVPADFVASAMTVLGLSGAKGTFHLACGWKKSITVGQAVALVAQGLERPHRARLLPRAFAYPLRVVGNKALGGLASRREAFAIAHHQLHQTAVFDTFLADLALAPHGIVCPAPEDWIAIGVRAAEEQHWPSPSTTQPALHRVAQRIGIRDWKGSVP